LFSSPNHEFGMVLFGTSDTYNINAEKFPGHFQNVVCPRAIKKLTRNSIDN
jgi:hypothetical protein